jgi:SAM-dependent methyltransferase
MSVELGESPSSAHIADAMQRRPSGRVLDVGCGEGHDSLYFARRGYEVDALDIDESALDILAKKALSLNVDVQLLHEDITTFTPVHTYDIILADRSLYFLPTYDAFKAAVIKLQEATALGGIHTNTILSEDDSLNPGPRLTMGRYAMFNLYMNNPQWERRHEWKLTDPLGRKCVALTAQKISE